MPLSVKKLLQNTPRIVKARTRVCSIRTIGQGKIKNVRKYGKVYELRYVERCLDGERKITIRYVGNLKPGINKRDQEDPQPHRDTPVWVSCTCPWFKFVCEYALAKVGSSDIKYCNGDPPVIRNPKQVPILCKHCVLALEKSIKDWRFVVNRPKRVPSPSTPSEVEKPQKPTPKQRKPRSVPVLDQEWDEMSGDNPDVSEISEKPYPRPLSRSPLARDRNE